MFIRPAKILEAMKKNWLWWQAICYEINILKNKMKYSRLCPFGEISWENRKQERWRSKALDTLAPHGQMEIGTSWAPKGAKTAKW